MYKRIKGKKFKRTTDQRRAFIRSLAANLILRERIQTTKVRAKEAAKVVERYVTRAKKNDTASKRLLLSYLPQEAALKLISDIAPRFASRQGGYTRVIKLGQRLKDGSEIAIVEFVEKSQIVKTAKNKKESKESKVKKPKDKPKAEKAKKGEAEGLQS